MIGASTALVAQTYHISSDDFNFLLYWVLLEFPLVYLMRASVPAIIYIIGITASRASSLLSGIGKRSIGHFLSLLRLYRSIS
ncbi:MAG TPA: DUF2157 domain-containing protein [Candidatus Omnitrophica bacterium]|nr:DUF2157 domain-containing protein [Candidatus Omnitrophota bacterium]